MAEFAPAPQLDDARISVQPGRVCPVTIGLMEPFESRGRAGGSSLPPLVVVGGAPATGKTTLAHRLAVELHLPLFTKDRIKELLGDTLGASDVPQSKQLGAASYELLYAITGWLLDAGTGAILESNFWRGASESSLQPLVARAQAVLIHCETAPNVVLQRFTERFDRGERHAVHFDIATVPRLHDGLRSGLFDPLDLPIPTLRVDTADGYDPP
ncbi:MAG: AAA family ATPase, partial [Dehalococcoidia bacterium]